NRPIKPSKKSLVTDISIKNFNRVFIFITGGNDIKYPKDIISNFKNKDYAFYNQLFSSSGIFFNDDLKYENPYYKQQDTIIRDYNLDVFSEKILNKSVNFM
ncbi:hypothetical protein, partial [Rosenbergiella nectarea]|uniref:hypothetical protein n=1 Tax=Rosenbergiella nectarea TaxID=988801 RepID=UPI001F4F136F